jgi:hypothetical protein
MHNSIRREKRHQPKITFEQTAPILFKFCERRWLTKGESTWCSTLHLSLPSSRSHPSSLKPNLDPNPNVCGPIDSYRADLNIPSFSQSLIRTIKPLRLIFICLHRIILQCCGFARSVERSPLNLRGSEMDCLRMASIRDSWKGLHSEWDHFWRFRRSGIETFVSS